MARNDYFNILKDITLDDIPLKDIFSRYNIFNETNNYFIYKIKDGDDLLSISNDFYGTKRFWWIVALYNDIIDPFYDMPLTENELRDYVNKYLDEEAESGETFNELYQSFKEENDLKREIKILNPDLLQNIMKQFKNEINKIE